MFYSRLGPALAELSKVTSLTPEQQKTIQGTVGSSTPTLVLVYGQPDRIELASTGNPFGMSMERLLMRQH